MNPGLEVSAWDDGSAAEAGIVVCAQACTPANQSAARTPVNARMWSVLCRIRVLRLGVVVDRVAAAGETRRSARRQKQSTILLVGIGFTAPEIVYWERRLFNERKRGCQQRNGT